MTARRVALGVASAVAIALAGPLAWGHSFPPVHTVVVQVEPCEVALLIGYATGTGDSTERIIARVASQPKSHARSREALRETLTAYALGALWVTLDGATLVPTGVRAKIGLDAGGARPTVVVLATYAVPRGGKLAIAARDPRTTRISWQDRSMGRVAHDAAPAEGRWFAGVASFLLPVGAPPGGSSCASTTSSSPSSPR